MTFRLSHGKAPGEVLPAICLATYVATALLLAKFTQHHLQQTDLEYSGTQFWAYVVSIVIWCFGPSACSLLVPFPVQLRWFPLVLTAAALQAALILLIVRPLFAPPAITWPSITSLNMVLVTISLAAAFAYGLFMACIWLIWGGETTRPSAHRLSSKPGL